MNFSNWFGSSDKATDPLQRIERALSSVSTSIMIADENRTIVFANRAVLKMLSYRETDIRKELPNFNANTIVGSSIDIFHKNPAHQAGILSRLTETYEGNIKIGGLRFRLVTNPILAEDNTYLGSVVEWHDRTTEIAMEQNLARILGALESATTNVMIADNERNIFYMNKSVEKMFRETESELRKQLPHFSVDKLIGSNMDIFHKNPAHQMQLLASLSQTFTSQIKVGDLHFRLVCNPIFDAHGERIATVVEWVDRTQEVRIEEEINAVVLAAGAGDFKPRISTENKKDFFLKLAEGLNNLLTITNSGLNDINRVMTAIADGDLTVRVEEEYEGSFDDLKDACNQTAEKLAMMLNDIQVATETINTASNEISKGNTDLSSRTEQQASSLEETASSMEELTSTVRQNADNAKQANILATKSTEIAEEGGRLINSVVKTMSSINESSEKIADIIGVIDGIAFQTNILAINAKVEAARAGEQGRGFAVVASEVGTLAQRSANAAKEIKALISDSVSNVNQGNELVNKSGETMKDIVTSIKHVNDIMAEIAAASAEQSAGLDEVGKAVLQMDEMTQQNAALVEQAAAAAESLLSQSEQLARNVTQFKVAEGQATQPSTRFLEANNNYSTQKSTSTRKVALPTKNMIKPARPDDDEWEAF